MFRRALTCAGVLAAIVLALADRPAEGSPVVKVTPCIEACFTKADAKVKACVIATCKGSCQGDEKACDDCATRCVMSNRDDLKTCRKKCDRS